MLTSYLAMQNAILQQNIAERNLMMSGANMLNAVNFTSSQPLKPQNFAAADRFEMQNKAEETKLSVAKRLADAYEKALGAQIKRSTPKYGGVDYKA